MAKEETPGIDAQIGASFIDFVIPAYSVVNPDSVVTQIIDNVIGHLDTLRRQIEGSNRKDISDVREAGDTMGTALLTGVEASIDYYELVTVINSMKSGQARRRVALEG